MKYRLASEYDVKVRIEPVPQHLARWVSRVDGAPVDLDELARKQIGIVTLDARNRPVILFEGEWSLHTAERFHPELAYAETAVGRWSSGIADRQTERRERRDVRLGRRRAGEQS